MKTICQLYIRDLNHWIVYKNGQFAVKRESEYPGENAVTVFVGKYKDCKSYIDNEWTNWQLALLS